MSYCLRPTAETDDHDKSEKEVKRRSTEKQAVSANGDRSRQVFFSTIQSFMHSARGGARGSLEAVGEALGKLPFYLYISFHVFLIASGPVLTT
jgi:hypothetical protein